MMKKSRSLPYFQTGDINKSKQYLPGASSRIYLRNRRYFLLKSDEQSRCFNRSYAASSEGRNSASNPHRLVTGVLYFNWSSFSGKIAIFTGGGANLSQTPIDLVETNLEALYQWKHTIFFRSQKKSYFLKYFLKKN